MTPPEPGSIEAETLVEFLARPEVTPQVYAMLRALHNPGRRGEEPSQRIWNLTRGFQPTVHVGSIRDQILAAPVFPPDTWADAKSALLHLEAGLKEFGAHAVKRLILRPRRERLEAALRSAPNPPSGLARRIDAAMQAAST